MNLLFKRYPALHAACLLALSYAFSWNAQFVFLFLLFPLLLYRPKFSLVVFILIQLYTPYHNFPKEGKHDGEAIVCFENQSLYHAAYTKYPIFSGVIQTFTTKENQQYRQIPCSIRLPKGTPFQVDRFSYHISNCTLISSPYHTFSLYLTKESQIMPIPKSFSLIPYRIAAKKWIKKQIHKSYNDSLTRDFLYALVSGHVENRILQFHFRQLGLSHLLAISGFHFGLLALVLSRLFSRIMPKKCEYLFLGIFLTFFYLYLGHNPSSSRAWIGIILALIGLILEKPITPLNLLGVAFIIGILFHPLNLFHVGFQLSFCATFAILTLFTPMEHMLQSLIPKYTPLEIKQLSLIDRLFIPMLTFIRNTLALNLAIFFLTLPILLYHFHQYPLMSLIYNLYIPPLVAAIFILTLLGLLIPPLHHVTIYLIESTLTLITNPSYRFAYSLKNSMLTPTFTLLLLLTLFGVFLFLLKKGMPKEISNI